MPPFCHPSHISRSQCPYCYLHCLAWSTQVFKLLNRQNHHINGDFLTCLFISFTWLTFQVLNLKPLDSKICLYFSNVLLGSFECLSIKIILVASSIHHGISSYMSFVNSSEMIEKGLKANPWYNLISARKSFRSLSNILILSLRSLIHIFNKHNKKISNSFFTIATHFSRHPITSHLNVNEHHMQILFFYPSRIL